YKRRYQRRKRWSGVRIRSFYRFAKDVRAQRRLSFLSIPALACEYLAYTAARTAFNNDKTLLGGGERRQRVDLSGGNAHIFDFPGERLQCHHETARANRPLLEFTI